MPLPETDPRTWQKMYAISTNGIIMKMVSDLLAGASQFKEALSMMYSNIKVDLSELPALALKRDFTKDQLIKYLAGQMLKKEDEKAKLKQEATKF